jgi:uncharacterized membrane protein
MSNPSITIEQAELEMTLLQVDADSMSSSDLYVWLQQSGLSPELAGKLHNLVEKTKEIGGEVIAIGKIILIKIIEFAKENQNLAIGVVVGAVIAAMLSAIPVLGVLLAPIAMALGIISGHRLDKKNKGEVANQGLNIAAVAEDLIEVAKKFLQLLIDVFNIMFKNVI